MYRSLIVPCAAAICILACGGDDAPKPADAGVSPVAAGELAVKSRGCVTCHQSGDPKDGTLGGQTMPRMGTTAYPSNLTPDPGTGISGWTIADFDNAIRKGVDVYGRTLCSMPKFDVSDEELSAIAAYLTSLPPVHHAIPESACPPPPSDHDGGM